MMDGHGKSDRWIVPERLPNNAGVPVTEAAEGSEWTKGNRVQQTLPLGRSAAPGRPQALERIRQAARRDHAVRFTALLHHVYNLERLRTAYVALKRDAAAGIDGETWQHYGENLEANLQDLATRLKRGAYRAKPVRRAYIPKADGRLRPLGVPVLEDKLVQRAVVEVLTAIYEEDFVGFSYGCRPGRSPHDALDALAVALWREPVNWVLDADLRGFFDTLDHGWLSRFLEHRIADRRLVRLIQRWWRAGVLEEGTRRTSEVGTVQGGSISPLLANLYLHEGVDRWVQDWRRTQAHGAVIVVRYRDDFIVGFEHREEAQRFQAELSHRLATYGLELHPEKTRLIEFGRDAAEHRRRRGEGKPETFNFLGFTHRCGTTRQGWFTVVRHTRRQRWQAKLRAVKTELRWRLHQTIPEQGAYLGAVVRGHVRYYGVPLNSHAISAFRLAIGRLWRWMLERRSQRTRIPWARMARLVARWLPQARVCHPYPLHRLGVMTPGGSRMR